MGVYTDGKEILKDIIALSKGLSDMELKNKILELQTMFYELNDENRELRLENHDIKNKEQMSNELVFRNGVYTKGNDVYCSVCWDNNKKLIRVRKANGDRYGKEQFICDTCKEWRFSDIPYVED